MQHIVSREMRKEAMLKTGDKVALVAMSDPQRREAEDNIEKLIQTLKAMQLCPVPGDCIFGSSTGQQRAQVLMDFYRDEEVKAIFDISGGNLANGVLPYLDYEEIARSSKHFWGYSDLTTLINAVYAKTGKASVLYQIRNMVSLDHSEQQTKAFQRAIFESESVQEPRKRSENSDLFQISYEFVQGNELCGVVVGGNTHCFLKLAGTPYLPDLTGKVLLLEARSGLEPQIETYMSQLAQMGVFDKVSGILLGTFTKLEAVAGMGSQVEILKKYVRKDLPIAMTRNIGHGTDSKAIWIGKELVGNNLDEMY